MIYSKSCEILNLILAFNLIISFLKLSKSRVYFIKYKKKRKKKEKYFIKKVFVYFFDV